MRAVIIVLAVLFLIPFVLVGITVISYRAASVTAQEARMAEVRARTQVEAAYEQLESIPLNTPSEFSSPAKTSSTASSFETSVPEGQFNSTGAFAANTNSVGSTQAASGFSSGTASQNPLLSTKALSPPASTLGSTSQDATVARSPLASSPNVSTGTSTIPRGLAQNTTTAPKPTSSVGAVTMFGPRPQPAPNPYAAQTEPNRSVGTTLRPTTRTVFERESQTQWYPVTDPKTGKVEMKQRTVERMVPRTVTSYTRVANSSQQQVHGSEVMELVNQLREDDDEDARDEKMDELRQRLELEFSQMHKRQAKEIREMEERLAKLKSLHELRDENRDSIVDRRIDELLGKSDGLQWQVGTGPSVTPSRGYYDPSVAIPPGLSPVPLNSPKSTPAPALFPTTRPATNTPPTSSLPTLPGQRLGQQTGPGPGVRPPQFVPVAPKPPKAGNTFTTPVAPKPPALSNQWQDSPKSNSQDGFFPKKNSGQNAGAEPVRNSGQFSPENFADAQRPNRSASVRVNAAWDVPGVRSTQTIPSGSSSFTRQVFQLARDYASSNSQLEVAEAEANDIRRLYERGMISKIEMLKAESKVREFKSQSQLNKAELEEMRSNLNRALMRAEIELVTAERNKEELQQKYGDGVITPEREIEWSKTRAMGRAAIEDAQAKLEQFQRAMKLAGDAFESKEAKDEESSESGSEEQTESSPPSATEPEPEDSATSKETTSVNAETTVVYAEEFASEDAPAVEPEPSSGGRPEEQDVAKVGDEAVSTEPASEPAEFGIAEIVVDEPVESSSPSAPASSEETDRETEPAITDEPSTAEGDSPRENRDDADPTAVESGTESKTSLGSEPAETEQPNPFVPTSY